MRRILRCCGGRSRGAVVQPDGRAGEKYSKMQTSRLHNVGVTLQIQARSWRSMDNALFHCVNYVRAL